MPRARATTSRGRATPRVERPKTLGEWALPMQKRLRWRMRYEVPIWCVDSGEPECVRVRAVV